MLNSSSSPRVPIVFTSILLCKMEGDFFGDRDWLLASGFYDRAMNELSIERRCFLSCRGCNATHHSVVSDQFLDNFPRKHAFGAVCDMDGQLFT